MGTPVFKNILPAGFPNRPQTKLPAGGQLFIVAHETGNPSPGADAEMHIRFLQSAEAQRIPVSYHFSVDDRAIVQGLPLDEIGFHAGDGCDNPTVDIGCFRSIAIEGCINSDGDERAMRRNYAELIARIALGDPAFDWGSGATRGRFRIDQLKQHIQVSNPGPNQHHCPDRMLNEGFWPTFQTWIAQAHRDLMNGNPIQDEQRVPRMFDPPRTFRAQVGALLRASATRDSAVIRSLPPGTEVTCNKVVAGQIIAGDERWLQTTDSPRRFIHASGVTESI